MFDGFDKMLDKMGEQQKILNKTNFLNTVLNLTIASIRDGVEPKEMIERYFKIMELLNKKLHKG